MIDIHCHILPGLDDGAPDLATAVEMASISAADGIEVVIATPHVGTETALSMEMIIEAVTRLNRELQAREIPVSVLPGAEVASHGVAGRADAYRLASGSFLLVEFPHGYLPADALQVVYELVARGISPILAHPERNRSVMEDPELLLPLLEAGAEVQITAGSVLGEFGADIAACSRYLLKKRMVRYLATDSHSPVFRKPVLSRAVNKVGKIIGRDEARALVLDNPRKIIAAADCLRPAG